MDNFGVTKSNVKKEKLQVHCKSTIRQVNVLNYQTSFRYKLPNACKFSSNYVWSNWIFHSETVWRSTWISQWKHGPTAKLMWWENGQTAIYVCFQAKGLAQIDTLSFISSSGFHRLKFPLWLKSSFRVYSRQLLSMWLCELAQRVIFSSAWTFSRTSQTVVCQPFRSTALVLSPTDSG